MKQLKFKDFKSQWILDGTKTATLRLFDDKDLQIGDALELINSDTGDVFATASISEIIEKPLIEMNDSDLEGHEKWESKEAMIESMKSYYGGAVLPGTSGKVIRFILN